MSASPRLVKVCGLTREQDVEAAVAAGVDAVGFVFWASSPRAVSVERAASLARLAGSVLKVGVFVSPTAQAVRAASEQVGLDVVQIHGESSDRLDVSALQVWQAVPIGDASDGETCLTYEGRVDAILLDTKSKASIGGTGRSFDWTIAEALRPRLSRMILAGGLWPGNVAEAINRVRPDGVDASSGVEAAPGIKDAARIRAFVSAAREAFARVEEVSS